jgi:protein TonB
VKTAPVEQKEESPSQPRTARTPRPPAVESKVVLPDTSKQDTLRTPITVDSESAPMISEQPASPSNSYGTHAIDSTILKKEYIAAQYGIIRDKVYRALSYPEYAQEEGWQGTVRIGFLVNRDGTVDSIRVLKSSGFSLLDNDAVKAIRRAAPFPYAPARLQIILPVVYRLE